LPFDKMLKAPTILWELAGMSFTPIGPMYWSKEVIEKHNFSLSQSKPKEGVSSEELDK
jgi:hypothetical protein